MNINFFGSVWVLCLLFATQAVADDRPNILFAIADDWGWPHAGAYGDPVVKTPVFDSVARRGILFEHAFVSSPSCTPSRNSILTGQYHWRLGWGANLWSQLDTKHPTFPNLLEDSGYFVGHYRKSWGPGSLKNWSKHRHSHPAGKKFDSPTQFFDAWDGKQPFCFWFGASDPHRGYKLNSGENSGMDLSKIQLFPHFPDHRSIRSDVADYYWEVQRFDRELGQLLEKLRSMNQLDNTIVVVTGDHGMPFPRCKGNLYDSGTRVPMAAMWLNQIEGPRRVSDFVSTTDLAPTFLEAATVNIPSVFTGRSWMEIFQSNQSGRIGTDRNDVFFGKERHVLCQEAPDTGGTPMRAVRTDDYLLIWNLRPDRWPAGTPNFEKATIPGVWLGDCDNGPTKTYMVDHRNDDSDHRSKYDLAFGKRPEFELYDLSKDPGQIENVAGRLKYQTDLAELKKRLKDRLKETNDPRVVGDAVVQFEKPPYLGRGPRHPSTLKPRKKAPKKSGAE